MLLGLFSLLGRSFSKRQAAIFVASLAIIFAETIKELKYVFGRTSPETWTQNNPSFIHGGAYGFHFMHGGGGYQSFPSGHMGAACALLSVLWVWFPRWRWLYFIAVLVVGSALIVANYHFLGDVIADAFVGTSAGWMTMAIWDVLAPMGTWRRK